MDLSKRLDRPVVLVGLMGVGKSTVGRRLARRLGLSFVDSDAEIEGAAGYPAAEVFERYGERDFRDGERRLVARLVEVDVRVIATGGAAPLGGAFGLFVGKCTFGCEGSLPAGLEVASLGLTLQPLAIARAIFALDALDFRPLDSARLERLAAHRHCAFEQLALGKG